MGAIKLNNLFVLDGDICTTELSRSTIHDTKAYVYQGFAASVDCRKHFELCVVCLNIAIDLDTNSRDSELIVQAFSIHIVQRKVISQFLRHSIEGSRVSSLRSGGGARLQGLSVYPMVW